MVLHSPLQFIISIFSWDHSQSQVKLETVLMQNFRGQTNSIMVFLKVAYYKIYIFNKKHYGIFESGLL